MKKTFYIIDDHEMLRSGTSNWITTNSDWHCAGDAGNHQSALEDLKRLSEQNKLPSIVLCDLNFYGENIGLGFIKELNSLYPLLKVVIYSMYFAAGIVNNAIQNGAKGYVSKNASSSVLLECMERVLAGDVFIQEELKTNLIKYNQFTDALTRREKQVMDLLLQHYSNDQIAASLDIKKRAVENYISLIYEKTGVNDRAELLKRFG